MEDRHQGYGRGDRCLLPDGRILRRLDLRRQCHDLTASNRQGILEIRRRRHEAPERHLMPLHQAVRRGRRRRKRAHIHTPRRRARKLEADCHRPNQPCRPALQLTKRRLPIGAPLRRGRPDRPRTGRSAPKTGITTALPATRASKAIREGQLGLSNSPRVDARNARWFTSAVELGGFKAGRGSSPGPWTGLASGMSATAVSVPHQRFGLPGRRLRTFASRC
jgi:hypothetical protein